jgi:hypothetical protein
MVVSHADNSQPVRSELHAPSSEAPTNGPYIFESLLMPSISKDIRNFVHRLQSLLHFKR